MKKFRIVLLIMVSILMVTFCTSCKDKTKVFAKGGITVTLTDKFKEVESDEFIIYLENNGIYFSGESFDKSDTKLESFTKDILQNKEEATKVYTYTLDSETFQFAYYTVKSEKNEDLLYRYMLVTKEGQDKYYVMNFWTLNKDFGEYEEQFFNWAKTIKVA